LVFLAVLATIVTLARGVASMAEGGAYDFQHSHHWMMLRVLFQATAVGLVLLGLLWQAG
jgi:hypothetical protein